MLYSPVEVGLSGKHKAKVKFVLDERYTLRPQ